jgi:hypothetical protein
MRRGSPFWRSYHETIHMLRLDSAQCIFGFFVSGITPDSHPERRYFSVDPGLIASLHETGCEFIGF